jgi:RHS repeat-associated protein
VWASGGTWTGYGYDADGLITSAGSEIVTLDAASGFVTGTTLGSTSDLHVADTYGAASSYSLKFGSNPLYSYSLVRDAVGRITDKVETVDGTTTTYSYARDPAGHLQQVKIDGTVVATYAWDSNGNRLSVTTPGGTTAATYGADDRLTSFGTTTYAFGLAGDLQTKTEGTDTTTYHYDAFGNLLTVQRPAKALIEYVIDGGGRRVGKKVAGVLQRGWLYGDALRPLAELDGFGNVVATFVYGVHGGVPDYLVKGGVNYRVVSDVNGSVRLVVNAATGAIAQRIDYDAFGVVTNDTNPGFQPFGFSGGLYDSDTGLVRFGTRDYDAATGRWTRKDPSGFVGGDGNLFAYAYGDPVTNVDRDGHFAVAAPVVVAEGLALAGAAVAATAAAVYGGKAVGDFARNQYAKAMGLTATTAAATSLASTMAAPLGGVCLSVSANKAQGKKCEDAWRQFLNDEFGDDYNFLEQVFVAVVNGGIRFVDFLVQHKISGDIVGALEVKSGGAYRSNEQFDKDVRMEYDGGRIPQLAGKLAKFATVVVNCR